MQTEIDRLLEGILKTQRTLGEENFLLSPKVLSDFLQNEHRVLAEDFDRASHAKPIGCATEHVASVSSSFPSNLPQSVLHTSEAQTSDNVGMSPVVTLPSGTKAEQWQWLKEKVLSCPNCLQHVPEGKKPVFGSGNLDADIFFCGEAPGAEEEEQGEVFVGRAGQLLTKIIEAMGLRRSDVYIGNIMNWRPETPNRIGNRPPTQEEMRFCLPYLIGQVEIVRPKVLVALGLTAVNGLLGYDANRKMRDCRGKWFEFHKIPLLVTYHPSYLLRNGTSASKRMVWEDMLCVMKFLKMPISEKQEGYFL